MVVFALTRIPGVLPQNFSAGYALMFCAGVYFPKRLAWWLPFLTMLITDVLLNWHYGASLLGPEMIGNYLVYLILVLMGKTFTPKASFLWLLGGGVLGAIVFYLVTNTFSWLFNPFQNPEYTKTFAGWLTALTKGVGGYPETWQFFRNTLMSGGLFTGLFAGAMKLLEAMEPAEEEEPAEEQAPDEKPEEAKA
ncbi:MAG: hypothetical protein JWQ71_1693 [Pedosphaera sp.]|nr:hypothetical protein [Pedosphaera sp.]